LAYCGLVVEHFRGGGGLKKEKTYDTLKNKGCA
jgi:hypothetical protein